MTMVRFQCAGCLALVLGLALPGRALAHHSFAAVYDQGMPVLHTGTVERFSWQNPHALLWLTVSDEAGRQVRWVFEMGSVRVLERFGWSVDTLRAGDRVTVQGFAARSGAGRGAAVYVTTPGRMRLTAVLPFR